MFYIQIILIGNVGYLYFIVIDFQTTLITILINISKIHINVT